MEALIKIQSELKAPKNQYNSFGKYKYRNCEDILEALKPLLLKYECTLTITDNIQEVCGLIVIESTAKISNKEGAFKKVMAHAGIDVNRKGMDIAQSFGASSSYARKYALNGLFLIDDTKDPDTTNTHGKEEKESETDTRSWLNKGTDLYKQAVEHLKKGGNITQIEAKYRLSKEVRESLISDGI